MSETQDISSLVERGRNHTDAHGVPPATWSLLQEMAAALERLQAELATVRERTIEEAARVADQVCEKFMSHNDYEEKLCAAGADEAATAIRSLGDTPE